MRTFIHEYKGYGAHPSRCKVHIAEVGTQTWVGFEDMNEGTSVTNASEKIATEIVEELLLNPANCKFFEWYPQYDGMVSQIFYKWYGPVAAYPEWKYFCDSDENPFLTGDFPFAE